MSAHSINPRQFEQLKKLLRIGRSEALKLGRTIDLVVKLDLVPKTVGIERFIANCMRDEVPARELCRQLNVRIKR